MPVALGESYTKILIFAYAAALLPLSLGLWGLGYCSAGYGSAALFLGGFFLFSCYRNLVASPRFGRAFGASIFYILGILLAVVIDVSVRAAR
jgi:heme O synthase-like polyprenyltransferase